MKRDKHWRKLVFTTFLMSCIFTSPTSYAKDLKMAFGEARPPFVFKENGNWKGFEIDIVREALKHKGHTLKYKRHIAQ